MTDLDIYSIPGFTDPVSSLSHLLGAGVFAVASVFLLRRAWGRWGDVFFLAVFAFSSVFLLAMSGVYHLLARGGGGRMVLGRLDHAAIFVLIAGSFTPVHGILFRGLWRWGPLFIVWAAAATGITLKTIFFARFPEWFGLTIFLGLGWLGVFSGLGLAQRYGYSFLRPLIWGAAAYTVGALLEFLRWPVLIPHVVGPHELFHFAVLCGIGCHWRFMSRIADGVHGVIVPTISRTLVLPSSPRA